MTDSAETTWRRRRELGSLLQSCRSRLPRTDSSGRDGCLRQQDVADLVGISVRYYAAFERGDVDNPSIRFVESVATALRMDPVRRSALHLLALGHDPPMPIPQADGTLTQPHVPSVLRNLVRRFGTTPAAVTDEMWTILAANDAMTAWMGGYCEQVPAGEQNLILYLFSPQAEQALADVESDRQAAVAGLRYQYARNISSPRFASLVTRLLATGDEARSMWERHDIEFPRRMYQHRLRNGHEPGSNVDVVFTALSACLSLLVLMLPED